MFEVKTIVTDDELTLKFQKNSESQYVALDSAGKVVGTVFCHDGIFEVKDSDQEEHVFMNFKFYMTRPEYKVGRLVEITGRNLEELMEEYEELLVGAYILNHPNEKIEHGKKQGYEYLLDWLRTTDFYTSPASTVYHESFQGGLLIHTLKVYNEAILLSKTPRFKDVSLSSVTIASLTHDWCKIGSYESYMKNVKNEQTGQWEKVAAYKKNFKGIPLGHGVTSMFLASRFFKLSIDEACAIRFHMGKWNTPACEDNELQEANHRYPLVYLIQFADQLSITNYVGESYTKK